MAENLVKITQLDQRLTLNVTLDIDWRVLLLSSVIPMVHGMQINLHAHDVSSQIRI